MPVIENDLALEQAVLRTLTYFDLFNYPLKSSELLNFLQLKSSKLPVEKIMESLVTQKQIAKSGDLYSLQFDAALFERRKIGNCLADSLLPRVKQQADLILKFPFVRSVMASGSFSKNFMDEKSDFDFFIVCAPQRIWISRMLLVLYKKLFLRNSHKHFCVNYFVDETHLEIDEKNIFTATELATVLPLNGFSHYKKLMESNRQWLFDTFPNFKQRAVPNTKSHDPRFKKMVEFTITLFFANYVNRFFKRITLGKWKRTYSQFYSSSDFKIAFKSTDSVSKNHPRNFQKKILDLYQDRVTALSKKVKAA
jgi:hypothetical protein